MDLWVRSVLFSHRGAWSVERGAWSVECLNVGCEREKCIAINPHSPSSLSTLPWNPRLLKTVCQDHQHLPLSYWITTIDVLTWRSFVTVFPASSKMRDAFDQIEDEYWRKSVMFRLSYASSLRHSDDETGYRRFIKTEFRETAIWSGPRDPHSWRNSNCMQSISALTFKPTAEWKEQVKELVMALKVITSYQCSFIYMKMFELVQPRLFAEYVLIGAINKDNLKKTSTMQLSIASPRDKKQPTQGTNL
jgi:hypothetical protein